MNSLVVVDIKRGAESRKTSVMSTVNRDAKGIGGWVIRLVLHLLYKIGEETTHPQPTNFFRLIC
jgi:hypothetical protein